MTYSLPWWRLRRRVAMITDWVWAQDVKEEAEAVTLQVCFSSFLLPHLVWRALVVDNIWDFRWEHDYIDIIVFGTLCSHIFYLIKRTEIILTGQKGWIVPDSLFVAPVCFPPFSALWSCWFLWTTSCPLAPWFGLANMSHQLETGGREESDWYLLPSFLLAGLLPDGWILPLDWITQLESSKHLPTPFS